MTEKKRLGVALCGSYCTYESAFRALEELCEEYEVTAIFSEHAAGTDSRFGTAEDFRRQLEKLTGKEIIDSIVGAEPIGPKKLLDALLVMPCTGNTLAKLSAGVTDSDVTMAVKAHLRNDRPVIIAVATNDGLAASAVNIGALLNRKQYFFVPFRQDDPLHKPRSLVADYSLAKETVRMALAGKQLQPILTEPCRD